MDENLPLKDPPSPGRLFLSFLLLGATAFGGPAMVEFIRRLAVEEKGWLSEGAFRDGVALCSSIPGATAIQVAGYVGLRIRGIAGAAAAFAGFALPAFLFMMVLSALYLPVMAFPPALSLFRGLKVLVVAIVGAAAVSFGRSSLSGIRQAAVAGLAAALFIAGVNPIPIILLAAALGVLLSTPLPRESGGEGSPMPSTAGAVLSITLAAVLLAALLFMVSPALAGIFALMARIDIFAFGGGQASLPLLFHEVVTVRGWLDVPTFLDGIALGQVTPGPIVISATFIGYLLQGPAGGVVATLGIFLPSFLVMAGTAPYFDRVRAVPALDRAFGGVVASFAGLLLAVTVLFSLQIPWDLPRAALALGAFTALLARVRIPWVVLAGCLLSLLLF
jgi:chromate transporter